MPRINNMFECANDEEVRYSYEELVAYWHRDFRPDEPRIPLVPMCTYKGNIPSERCIRSHTLRRFGWEHDTENQPVVMKGAWEIMVNKYSTRRDFNDEVRDRFLRFYKATILNLADAQKWKEKIDTLMHKDVGKRYLYRRTNNDGMRINLGYMYAEKEYNHTVFIFGIRYHFLDREKVQVIKAIYRHIKKLSTLTNLSKEKEKWQQLIQQAI